MELREAISDITDNVTDQGEGLSSVVFIILSFSVDRLVQNMKDALITKEMQEALNTIEIVLGEN